MRIAYIDSSRNEFVPPFFFFFAANMEIVKEDLRCSRIVGVFDIFILIIDITQNISRYVDGFPFGHFAKCLANETSGTYTSRIRRRCCCRRLARRERKFDLIRSLGLQPRSLPGLVSSGPFEIHVSRIFEIASPRAQRAPLIPR